MTKPAFLTFTGVDRSELLPGMRALSMRYPIEWGILLDPAREDQPIFPGIRERRLIQSSTLRLSAHICGSPATLIVEGRDPGLNLEGFTRLQINHSRTGSGELEIQNSHLFARKHNMQAALQCQGAFPSDDRADWLYDVSFGTGRAPAAWPVINSDAPFCGYSGGLGPANIADVLAALPVAEGIAFWLDMESGVRTGDKFDLDKCTAVCEAVFGRKDP